jgi:hypothetical protein
MTVNDNLPAAHCIADGVLTVSVQQDSSSVEVAGKVIPRRTVYFNGFSAVKRTTEIALTVYILNGNLIL